jgi:hypothetical protein
MNGQQQNAGSSFIYSRHPTAMAQHAQNKGMIQAASGKNGDRSSGPAKSGNGYGNKKQ